MVRVLVIFALVTAASAQAQSPQPAYSETCDYAIALPFKPRKAGTIAVFFLADGPMARLGSTPIRPIKSINDLRVEHLSTRKVQYSLARSLDAASRAQVSPSSLLAGVRPVQVVFADEFKIEPELWGLPITEAVPAKATLTVYRDAQKRRVGAIGSVNGFTVYCR